MHRNIRTPLFFDSYTMKTLTLLAVAALALASHASAIEISQVMKDAMKGETSLYQRVAKGQASEDDAQLLFKYVSELAKNTPPRGDKGSWDRKTKALISAAQQVAFGNKQALRSLQTAGNCKSCHSAHKE